MTESSITFRELENAHVDDVLKVVGGGNLVLSLAEDDADESGRLAEVLDGVAVADFKFVAALAAQLRPVED